MILINENVNEMCCLIFLLNLFFDGIYFLMNCISFMVKVM